MADKGEIVYSPVEPFSGVRRGDGSQNGVIGAGNGAVTRSDSIRSRRVVSRIEARDAYEQVEQLSRRLGGWA